jgi:hypothetical protein
MYKAFRQLGYSDAPRLDAVLAPSEVLDLRGDLIQRSNSSRVSGFSVMNQSRQ